MEKEEILASGQDEITNSQIPSGTPEQQNHKDFVKYETYKKTLNQEKNLRAKLEQTSQQLEEFKRIEQEREEKALQEQGEYQKLLEIERKKREEMEQKATQYEQSIMQAHKLNAFKEKLPGRIANPAYYDFVDLEKIVINPDTGEIAEESVQSAVDEFLGSHQRLIVTKNGGLPNQAPTDGSAGKLSLDQWKKFPLKERKERMSEVFNTNVKRE